MNDLITVIVPVYNVEQYLNRCVDSIINQLYKNLEIILVDDGSPDNCGRICDEYAKRDNRIHVIHKENGGLSDARNAGIDIAKGKYITFVDSDDYINDNYITCLHEAIINNKSDIAIGLHVIKYNTGITINKYPKSKNEVINAKEVFYRILYNKGIDLSAWAKLYKTELFKNIRYPKGRLFEDSATTYKLIDKADKISLVNEYIYNYMIRVDSISSCKFNNKKIDLITSTIEMTEYIKNKYPDLKNACNCRLMYAYLSTLTQLAKSKEQKEYINYRNELMEYIKINRKKALKDKETPKRDRIALYCTILGFDFFRFSWSIYERISGRK